MNGEEIEKVREHLRKRIEQSNGWAVAGFPTSAFLNYCETIGGRRCTIVPYRWLDLNEPGLERKQSKGIRFQVTWQDPPREAAYVDVLLAPEWKADERGLGPAIKVKAVDLDDKKKVRSQHDIIAPYVRTDDCNTDKIDVFYRTWLQRAFANGPNEKILECVYPIEGT